MRCGESLAAQAADVAARSLFVSEDAGRRRCRQGTDDGFNDSAPCVGNNQTPSTRLVCNSIGSLTELDAWVRGPVAIALARIHCGIPDRSRSCAEGVPVKGMGVTMSLYRSIANAVGTPEAIDLAYRLAAWHDGMVIHRRRAGDAPGFSCDTDCPHENAESLWREALETYGERAHECAFLRTYGLGSVQHENVSLATVGV
jgi:hypothetical protein